MKDELREAALVQYADDYLVSDDDEIHFGNGFDAGYEAGKQELTAERDKYRDAYNELIFAVSHKYESETRHQTALKYIQQAEESSGEACANPDNGADFARQVKAELEGE